MDILSERLEVRLSPEKLELLRQEAQQRGMPVAKLVREAIDLLLKEDRQVKQRVAEALFQVGAPVADWAEMKKDIEDSHLKSET